MTISGFDAYLVDSRANWDDCARVHEASGCCGMDDLAVNPAAITRELRRDLPFIGGVAGKDVIHLQCRLGFDTAMA